MFSALEKGEGSNRFFLLSGVRSYLFLLDFRLGLLRIIQIVSAFSWNVAIREILDSLFLYQKLWFLIRREGNLLL